MMFQFDLTKTIENMKKNVKVVHDPEKYDKAIVVHPFYKEMIETIIKTIKLNSKKPHILEIGMGTGTLTEHLINLEYKRLIGLEPERIDYEFVCKKFIKTKKPNVQFKNCDLWGFKPEDKFDIIVSSFVDHHIPTDKKVKYYEKILDLLEINGIYLAGEELISDYSTDDERIIQLFKYHGYIIKTCIENSDFDMAEIETRALKNGIERWDEFKISSNKYKETLNEAKMNILRFDKLGPKELKNAGIYVIVSSH